MNILKIREKLEDRDYYVFVTEFNLIETLVFSKNKIEWGWIQNIEEKYIYGYIERYNTHKIDPTEFSKDIILEIDTWLSLIIEKYFSIKYIEKVIKTPTKESIINKYKDIKGIKTKQLKEIKIQLELKKYEVIVVESLRDNKYYEVLIFTNDRIRWKTVMFDEYINKLMEGTIDINLNIWWLKVFEIENHIIA